ncbi:hypothetical protein COY05_00425 [Candidatus Peregrinibacteria bacterium CG_4_10_14_0_2_um_filter_38_24]|nr:MAG: hypothetical protein COY05_00425 [Candidatus Peregrinibacteria bacterium CG_4_10_14_0_2_um_filter_38_24]PJC38817.1 MAG: hypothetical protein CO044_02960 [Candidatus Peregrinibacteria bacterium CG_4_9_14_0_2_um_filter_38_9]
MKKIIYSVILVAIFGLVYAGCSVFGAKVEDVFSIEFYIDDGNIPDDYFSVSTLKLIPSPGDRTLSLDYGRTYPKAEGSVKAQNPDVKNNGVVGGEFYDRFEEAVALILDGKLKNSDSYDASTGVGKFAVSLNLKNGKNQKYDYSMIQNDVEFDPVRSLFLDVTNLFSQDVY